MKTALAMVVLGFGVRSAPAWAMPFPEGNSPDKAEHEDGTTAKNDDLLPGLLRFQTSNGSGEQPKAHASSQQPKTQIPLGKWIEEYPGSITHPSDHTPHPNDHANIAPVVPETSALMLFGVGCLVTRRALTRRESHVKRTREISLGDMIPIGATSPGGGE